MTASRVLTITLPERLAEAVAAHVAAGDFADESEMIAWALVGLLEPVSLDDARVRSAVLPVIAAHDADPSRAIPLEQAFDRILARRKTKRAA